MKHFPVILISVNRTCFRIYSYLTFPTDDLIDALNQNHVQMTENVKDIARPSISAATVNFQHHKPRRVSSGLSGE